MMKSELGLEYSFHPRIQALILFWRCDSSSFLRYALAERCVSWVKVTMDGYLSEGLSSCALLIWKEIHVFPCFFACFPGSDNGNDPTDRGCAPTCRGCCL